MWRFLAAKGLLGGKGLLGLTRKAGLMSHVQGLALSRLGQGAHLKAALTQKKAQVQTRRGLILHGLAIQKHAQGLFTGS